MFDNVIFTDASNHGYGITIFLPFTAIALEGKFIFDHVIFTDGSNHAYGGTIFLPFMAIALEGNFYLIM